ncbi:restriction endonuclease [Flavobacterium sp. KACC 22763]|uniref:restriction endonuclease n=1 Tax=Flavobacterium sp. KACC 22763 TaxID=3025668 RepID=UPI002365E016|nr:restriction endonuclease [Flavobacterium sp. KACC 22763]WDF65466.1 restriction endonuclease [Flavobacterium sp. KACC 22763]
MENQNKLDWKTYEFITKYIYETLGQKYNINIEGYGHNCKIKGKSGVEHQIDVLTSETDNTGTYRTAIECKYWNKKVTKETVMKLLAIINDTDIERGIIVSKSGYTPDAQQFAKYCNILIVHLRETGEEDNELQKEFHLFDLRVNIKMNIKSPEVINIIAKDLDNNVIEVNENYQYHILIEQANGKRTRLFDEIMVFKEYINKQKPFKTVTKTYEYENSNLRFQDSIQKIKSITYTGLLTVQDKSQNSTFSIVDNVWLIMKKIFEEQTFIISESGLIAQYLGKTE